MQSRDKSGTYISATPGNARLAPLQTHRLVNNMRSHDKSGTYNLAHQERPIGQQYALLILAHSGRNWNILRQKQYISIRQFTIKGRVPHHVWAAKTRSSPTRRVMRRSSMCSNRGKTYFRVVSRTSRASAAVILLCTRRYASSFANASS
jgi:hypothetical protein